MISVTITRDGIDATVIVDSGQPVEIHVAALQLLATLMMLAHIAPAAEAVEPEEEAEDVDELEVEFLEKAAELKVEHSCDQCPRTFPTKNSVAAHRRAMHSGRRIECGEEGCDFTAGSTNVVAMHRSRAHGPKLAPITEPTPPLHVGPVDLDAARARAANSAYPSEVGEL